VIRSEGGDHCYPVASPNLSLLESAAWPVDEPSTPEKRLARAAKQDFQFIWRTIRRLGVVPDTAVDDAVQRVFEIAVRKSHKVEAGRERAFLFKTALLVAAEVRRGQRRRVAREVDLDAPVALAVHPAPMPDEQLEAHRARAFLDQMIEEMDVDLHAVFVLFELEGLTMIEIGLMLGLPNGTVASRLRRAREQFQASTRRARARWAFERGVR
jgi:RNA polymerase sigma-70 factor (ECF subfamily)